MLFYIFIVLILAALAAGVVFFILFFLKRKVKGTALLYPAGSALPNNDLSSYFSSVRHDNGSNMIVLRQSSPFRRCVVAVVYSSNGKKSFKRYALNFNESQQTCGIRLDALNISEYNVFVESVDGKPVKHLPFDNSLLFAIIYGLSVAVLYAIAIIMLVMYDSSFLVDYWPGYAIYYAFAAIGLLFPLIGIVGFIIINNLSKK